MRLWGVRAAQPGALLQFGVSPYRGHTTVLLDGTHVEMGDRILHLHLDNQLLAQLAADGRLKPWELVERVRDDIDAIAEEVASGRLGEVRALRGITVLATAATRAGFEVRPLPHNLRWALIRNISALVLASYHPGGIRELDRGLPWPGEVWMSSLHLQMRLKSSHLPTGRGAEAFAEPSSLIG
jgi:hypothetical protein